MKLNTSFHRPTKIHWSFPSVAEGQDWREHIASKSVRKIARKLPVLLEHHRVTYEILPLTEELYQDWFAYNADVKQRLNQTVLSTPEWFAKSADLFVAIKLIEFRLQGERVGAAIVSVSKEGVVTQHFKAQERIDFPGDSNTSLGTLTELVILEHAPSLSATKVSSGRSRNGFGFYNSVGYLVSKLKMGYCPEIMDSDPTDTNFQVTAEGTSTVWFVKEAGKVVCLAYPDVESVSGELKTYLEREQIQLTQSQTL